MDNSKSTPRFKSKKAFIAVVIAAIVAVVASAIVIIVYQSQKDEVIFSPDLVVYEEDSSPFQILSMDDDSITVSSMEGLSEGNVLNAGITQTTPYGMLRRLGASEPVDGGFRIQTEQADLTDAIQKCDVSFTATSNGEDGMIVDQGGERTEFTFIDKAYADVDNANIIDEKIGPLLVQAGNTIEGKFEIDWFSVKEMYLVDHASASIELDSLDFNLAELLEDNSLGLEVEDDSIVLCEITRPFPVVIAGIFYLDLNFTIKLTYSLEAYCNGITPDIRASFDRKFGFSYTAESGTHIINEDNSVEPHISFADTSDRVSIGAESRLGAKFSCLLYGFAGPEFGVGVAGDIDGILQVLDEGEGGQDAIKLPGLDKEFSGRFSAKVYVPITGRLLVEVDNLLGFLSGELLNIELFDTDDAITLLEYDWRFGTVWEEVQVDLGGDYRSLAFLAPDDWDIRQSDTYRSGSTDEMYQVIAYPTYREDELKNQYTNKVDDYVDLSFIYGDLSLAMLGRYDRTVVLEEVAPADFIPLPQNGNSFTQYEGFVVAKMRDLETTNYGGAGHTANDSPEISEYSSEEQAAFSMLVLVPKSWIGTREIPGNAMFAAFPYGGPNAAASNGIETTDQMADPDGGIAFGYYGNAEELSEEEYKTIVNILASLRVE